MSACGTSTDHDDSPNSRTERPSTHNEAGRLVHHDRRGRVGRPEEPGLPALPAGLRGGRVERVAPPRGRQTHQVEHRGREEQPAQRGRVPARGAVAAGARTGEPLAVGGWGVGGAGRRPVSRLMTTRVGVARDHGVGRACAPAVRRAGRQGSRVCSGDQFRGEPVEEVVPAPRGGGGPHDELGDPAVDELPDEPRAPPPSRGRSASRGRCPGGAGPSSRARGRPPRRSPPGAGPAGSCRSGRPRPRGPRRRPPRR